MATTRIVIRGLQIDVSGRVEGHREVLDLLTEILGPAGRALDDYSERPWSPAELMADAALGEGRTFLRPRREGA